MLSKTLQDGLNDYAIGDKLRTLRLKKKIGLVELGKHTGLSPALISKIERGLMFPTLPTLLRIALVFGWVSSSSLRARATSHWSRSCGSASACSFQTVPVRARWPIDSSRSTILQPSGVSTATMPSSSRLLLIGYGVTIIPASSSSSRSRAR